MAFTFLGASANSIKYLWESPGSELATIPRDVLINQCAAGPLRNLFKATNEAAAWSVLARGQEMSVIVSRESGAAVGLDLIFTGSDELVIEGNAAGALTTIVEFRFWHDMIR